MWNPHWLSSIVLQLLEGGKLHSWNAEYFSLLRCHLHCSFHCLLLTTAALPFFCHVADEWPESHLAEAAASRLGLTTSTETLACHAYSPATTCATSVCTCLPRGKHLSPPPHPPPRLTTTTTHPQCVHQSPGDCSLKQKSTTANYCGPIGPYCSYFILDI